MAMVFRRVVAPLARRSLSMGAQPAPSTAFNAHAQIPVLCHLDTNQLRFKVTKKKKKKKGKKVGKKAELASEGFAGSGMGGSGIGRVSAAEQPNGSLSEQFGADEEKMEQDALEMVKENPEDPEGYLMLGMVRMNVLGNLRDARSAFEDGLQACKDNPDLMYSLANCILSGASANEEHEEAIKLFERAVELDPDHHQAASDLALAYFLTEQQDKSVELLRGEVAKYPKDFDIRLRLGTILLMARRWDEAKAELEESLKDPDNRTSLGALDSLAEVAWSRENPDFQEAEALHAKLLEQHPDRSASYMSVARYKLHAHKDREAAREWATKAGEAEPGDPYVTEFLDELDATPKLD